MRSIAFVPVRAGSKSIPKKNIKKFCGKPLVYWTLMSLQDSKVDKIIIATDCSETKSIVSLLNLSKIEIYDREFENATDNASTESVILEYINKFKLLDTDALMLVQVTSPFTQTIHFNEGLDLFKKYDSILTCYEQYSWTWFSNKPVNYKPNVLPRSQDAKPIIIESTGLYGIKNNALKKYQCRIGRVPYFYKIDEIEGLDIDSKLDIEKLRFYIKNVKNLN